MKIECKLVSNLEDITKENPDIVFMPSSACDPRKHPNTLFIFGPHFGIFPSVLPQINAIQNQAKNAYYLQPSDWVTELFQSHIPNLPVVTFPFPVDTDTFAPTGAQSEKVLVYFKYRDPDCLQQVSKFLESKDYKFSIFDYGKKYSEDQYLRSLRSVKFGIWIGCHESQGFALQEALSTNVPLLVWNIRYLSDQYGASRPRIPATSTSFWDPRCGEVVYSMSELADIFNVFINKINTFQYSPRAFIHEHLSIQPCAERLSSIIQRFQKQNQ